MPNSSAGPNYAPNVFAAHPKAERVSKRGFLLAMEAMMEAGTIANDVSGLASKQRTFIVEVQK